MKKIVSIVLVMVLLASAVPLAVTPAGAVYETKIPFAGEDNELTKEELVNTAILPYMLGGGDLKLDDVGDASYVYAYWNGKPRTITDGADREVTFCRPIERLTTRTSDNARVAIAVGAGDKIVASENSIKSGLCPCKYYYTEAGSRMCEAGCMNCFYTILDGRLPDLPETSTGYPWAINYELIASLHPDMGFGSITIAEEFENKVGRPCVVASGSGYVYEYDYEGGMYGRIEVVGKALEREDEAQELIDFIESKIDMVKSVTEDIDPSEKPTVYFAPRGCTKGFYDPARGRDFTRTLTTYEPLDIAGGINVAKGEPGTSINVGIEQIIAWEPEYIFIACSSSEKLDALDIVRNAEDLQSIPAIQNDTVYNCFYPYSRGSPPDRSLFNMIFMAKMLHPDEFKDLDLEKEGNEIFEAFLGIDGVFTEYADYLIWPRGYLEAQQ